ncbi:MAG: DEAD/DEAH box helicase [Spirochaetaceae bacterium]|jgi:superfamily II DNA/RNA helicase|nr:DEAD/DEAH box helicase [Spirochaetaceae bacterium]
MKTFADLGISGVFAPALDALGIEAPTPVQERVIPEVLAGRNVLFEAETGSGKTYAYALPLLQMFLPGMEAPGKSPVICIACPTQELSSQQKRALEALGVKNMPLLIGGVSIKRQCEALQKGPPVVLGTPARLCELIFLKKLRLRELKALVLDEADRLFSKELEEWTGRLLGLAPQGTQLLGESATIDGRTEGKFAEFARDWVPVRIDSQDVLRKNIEHQALFAEDRDKVAALRSYLLAEKPPRALIFCARLAEVEKITLALQAKKIDCLGIHARAEQQTRKNAVDRFRSGKTPLLVTSDLTARGMDIPGITHIIQMDLPEGTAFIHRAGRTARAGRRGINMVIGNEWELRRYAALEKKLGITVYPKALYKGAVIPA